MNILALLNAAIAIAPGIASTANAIISYVSPGNAASARVAEALVDELTAAGHVGASLMPAAPALRSALQGQQVNDEQLAGLKLAADNLDAIVNAAERKVIDQPDAAPA